MASPDFEIAPSGQIELLKDHFEVDLEPDRAALDALADLTRADLPEAPRVLLLNTGQLPHMPSTIIYGDGLLPRYEDENDIIVNLLKPNQLDELNLTASVARALVDRRRAVINQRGIRGGTLSFLGGAGISGVSQFILDNPSLAKISMMTAVLGGMGGAAYFANRSEAPLPEIEQFAPPIKVVARDN